MLDIEKSSSNYSRGSNIAMSSSTMDDAMERLMHALALTDGMDESDVDMEHKSATDSNKLTQAESSDSLNTSDHSVSTHIWNFGCMIILLSNWALTMWYRSLPQRKT